MRRPLIAGNWKMHKTTGEAVALVGELRAGLAPKPPEADVLVAPPFTALAAVVTAAQGSGIAVAAQDMHWEKQGAFTGAISPAMLRDVGCSHVILGHSERRQLFGETDEGVGKKARAAFDNGLVPVLCVGETLPERDADQTLSVVERQLDKALAALSPEEAARAVIAYEPVWAIGTGRAATAEQAQEVHAFIRRRVAVSHGDSVAGAQRILYGGSVKPDNIGPLMVQPDIDGALVGGACLQAESFLGIVRYR
jgi:triosephosphate isomerase